MRLSVRELKNLVREAIYDGPGTAKLRTLQDPAVLNYKEHRRESSVTKLELRLARGPHRSSDGDWGELLVHIAENAGKRWDDDKLHTRDARHEHIISKQEFRDLLRSLGFDEQAIRDVEFDWHGGNRSGAISMNVQRQFVANWRKLFGNEKVVDLT